VLGDGDVKLTVVPRDPDGGTLGVTLQLWKTSTGTAFPGTPTNPQNFFVTSGQPRTFTAPKASLETAAGGTVTEFSWKVQVTDFYTGPGSTSGWSPTCNFKFDATPPAAPDLPDADALQSLGFTVGQVTQVPVTPPPSGTLPASYQYQVNGGAPGVVSANADGTASIPVRPTRFANVLTVSGTSPAGNLGEQAITPVFYAAAGAVAPDGDLTGDGTADLLTVGGSGMPSGLWLAPGRGDGQVSPYSPFSHI
jgi:hypothetical protein